MANAFKKYYDNKHNIDSSALIKARYDALTQGFNTDDVAAFDIGVCVAATTNSVPGSFCRCWGRTHFLFWPVL